ncbi:MAG: Cna B-type domain-containing protein, partial [Clostridia bacterium]|nr:Cna B-type domain-containing protein [Clostridia bacterium]
TNSYTPEETKVTVEKTWDDADDQDGKRGNVKATVQLYQTVGETKTAVGDPIEVGTEKGWSYTWEELPVYEDGVKIVYSVEESMSKDSEYEKDGDDATLPAVKDDSGTIEITNSYTPEETKVTVEKFWDDVDDQDGKRAKVKATVQLYQTVGETKTAVGDPIDVGTEKGWSHTWEELPVYEDGVRIIYSVVESMSVESEYTKSGDDVTLTAVKDDSGTIVIRNPYTPEKTKLTVEKTWDDVDDQDGKRAKVKATIQLYQTVGGEKTAIGSPVEVGTRQGWTYTWNGLPVYENGVKIVYSVEETMSAESEYTKSGDDAALVAFKDDTGTIAIKNSYKPETTKVTVEKIWDDADDKDGKRADVKATVQLYKSIGIKKPVGDPIEVGTKSGWSHTWSGLPVYENGIKIVYYVVETMSEDSGYTTAADKVSLAGLKGDSGTITITNTYEPIITKVTVEKIWDDANDKDGKRANVKATIQLYQTVGEAKTAVGDPVSVGTEKGWSHTWEELPVYESGIQIIYSVEETMSKDSEYTKSGDDAKLPAVKDDSGTIRITNKYTEVPKTSVEGSVARYAIPMGIAALTLAGAALIPGKKKKDEEEEN